MESDARQRILIVDDSSLNIRVLGETLSPLHEIYAATSGEEALKIANSDPQPDLILLDIVMPGIDGLEVCRRLKADIRTQDIPIIFITAMTDEKDEEMGLELGAVDYIRKPCSPPIVKARVKAHLELKRKSDILKNLSNRDGLTGIPNRRRFEEHFNLEWSRGVRSGSPLSIVMMDIDFFKNFNDNYGHAKGDECLIAVAEALNGCIKRPTDMVARYGGEEFVAILPETDFKGAKTMAESMRKAIEQLKIPHEFSVTAKNVTISVGLATTMPTMSYAPNDLINEADKMLYESKSNGRNQTTSMQVE